MRHWMVYQVRYNWLIYRDSMKICVLGGDGYCGWATALYLSNKGMRLRSSIISRAVNGTMSSAYKP